jgi:hypothetical protein
MFAAAYWAYRFVRGQVDGKTAVAFQHGRELINLERATHTFVEPSIQTWTAGKEWLIDAASWMYINSHFAVTLGALVFIYIAHNRSFYFVRNMFMVAMFLALVGYLAFPAAPPRFFPEWGFHDSVSQFTGIAQNDVKVNALFNPYAAVPSMHVGFALMLGFTLARLVKSWPAKVMWTLYPLLVTFVVVSTANHYVFDALTGAIVAAVSAIVASTLLARVRPQVWSFTTRGTAAAPASGTAPPVEALG